MAVAGSVVTITNAATLITKTDIGGRVTALKHRGTNPIFLGGPNVTTGTGYQMNTGDGLTLDLAAGDALYGIVASGTEPLHVLTLGWG